jgi:hypothetical protein
MEINKKSFESFFNFHKKLKETISTINESTDISVKFKIVKENNQSRNVQFTIKRFETKTLISNPLTIENLNLKYSNKKIMLNSAIYTLKTVEQEESFIIASIYSKELNIVGKLKFKNLEDCDLYFGREVVL